jgi:hypothetical protein
MAVTAFPKAITVLVPAAEAMAANVLAPMPDTVADPEAEATD